MSDGQADTPKLGDAWGDAITEERQAELKVLADKQREWAGMPEQERGVSHFSFVSLTGADMFWLAAPALCSLQM